MDRRLFAVAAVTAMLVARTAAADYTVITMENGNALLAHCQSTNPYDSQTCLGYSVGVTDTLSTLRKICPPVGETPEQGRDIIVNYLVAHPESRQSPASWLAQHALLAVWSCK